MDLKLYASCHFAPSILACILRISLSGGHSLAARARGYFKGNNLQKYCVAQLHMQAAFC